jgi:hypothetical protein
MLCDGTVVCGKSFRTPRNGVHNVAACVVLFIGSGRWRRRRHRGTGVDPPASPRTLAKEICRLAGLEDGDCFSGPSGGFERNVAPGCDLAGGSYNGIDSEEVG